MYKILIVEDDFVIAKTMKKHLTSWGYDVECAEDFKNVLAQFVSFDPQLVLLDISSYHSLMATIDAQRFEKCPRYRSSLSLQPPII